MFSNTIKLIFLILFSSSVAFSDDKLSNVIEDIFLDRKLDSEPACAIGVIENNKYIFQQIHYSIDHYQFLKILSTISHDHKCTNNQFC